MTRTFSADRAALLSPRTAKYVEAMVREDFDYDKWLKKVRQEEAEVKQAEMTGTSAELAAQIADPIKTSDDQHTQPNSVLQLVPKTMRVPRALRRPRHQPKSQTPKARLRRWLKKVRRAWGEFQSSRTRDAVYGYLEAVFAIVEHYRVRRRTNRLVRHAFKFADRPFDRNADPFSAIIRCTSGNTIDAKMISKWARALRYATWRKEPDMRLKTFMKKVGGLNACADGYAKASRLPH